MFRPGQRVVHLTTREYGTVARMDDWHGYPVVDFGDGTPLLPITPAYLRPLRWWERLAGK